MRLPRPLSVLRYLLLTGWTSVWAVVAFDRAHSVGAGTTDWDIIRFGSKALYGIEPWFRAGPLHLYAEFPSLQIGSPALAVNGAAQVLFARHGGYGGDWAVLAVMVALGVASVWALERIAATLHRSVVPVMVVAVPLLAAWGASLGKYGHLEDAFAVTGIVFALLAAVQGRGWPAGAALGVAVACKPWAVVAVPVLVLLGGQARRRAALLTLLLSVAPWLPFLAADPQTVRVASTVWPVSSGSALSHLGVSIHRLAPGWVRPVQFAAAVVVGWWVVRRDWTAALLAAFAVKVLFDPLAWSYYGIGPVAAAAVLDVGRARRVPVWTVSAVLVEFVLPLWLPQQDAGVARLVWAVGTLGALVVVPLLRRAVALTQDSRDREVVPTVGGCARTAAEQAILGRS